MRVLILTWEYPPHVVGGLGQHVMELSPALARQGVEVYVVTPAWAGGDPEEHHGNLHVYRVMPPDGPFADIHESAEQANVRMGDVAKDIQAQTGNFDLVHVHDWLGAFAGERLKHDDKVPLLATIHATEMGRNHGYLHTDLQQSIHSVEWWLTYEAWRVICCSKFMAEEVQRYFQTPANKIDIIPNGVDAARFERWQGVDLTAFRDRFALPDERLVFNVGRVVYEKGIHVLLDAVPLVLAEFPSAKFVIAGTGGMLGELRHRSEEQGLSNKVLFTGFVSDDDRDKLLAVADCVVFPSLYEPFGIVALEAMASHAPVVASDVGGLAEVVKHGETGVTVYPGDANSLAWGILHTLREPAWARQRADAAYKMVVEQYNWDHIAAQTIAVYERIVRERAQADW